MDGPGVFDQGHLRCDGMRDRDHQCILVANPPQDRASLAARGDGSTPGNRTPGRRPRPLKSRPCTEKQDTTSGAGSPHAALDARCTQGVDHAKESNMKNAAKKSGLSVKTAVKVGYAG